MNNHNISAYGTRIYLKAKAVKAVVTRERITVSVEESRKSRRGFVQNWKFNRHYKRVIHITGGELNNLITL